MTSPSSRHRIQSFARGSLLAILLLAGPGTALAADAIPDFGFPSWIRSKGVTVTADTRPQGGAEASITGTVALDVQVGPGANDTIELKLTGTWTQSTNAWAFTTPQADTANTFPDFVLQGLRLDKAQGDWRMVGQVSLAALAQKLQGTLPLPTTAGFRINEKGFEALFASPIAKPIGTLGNLGVSGLDLAFDDVEHALRLDCKASFAWRGDTFDGLLAWRQKGITFESAGKDTGKDWQLPNVAVVQVRTLKVDLGAAPMVEGEVDVAPASGSAAARILGQTVHGTLSGGTDGVVVSLVFSGSAPQVPLGGGGGFSLSKVTLAESSAGGTATWVFGGDASLQLPGSTLHGTFSFTGQGVTLTGVDLPPFFTGLTIALAPPSTGSGWSASFSATLKADSLRSVFTDMGLPAPNGLKDYPVAGSFTSTAFRVSFQALPPFPVAVPDWLPLKADSLKSFALTRELGSSGRMVFDFDVDFDFHGLPGLSSAPRLPLSGLLGPGVAPPPAAAQPSAPDQPSAGGGTGPSSGDGKAPSSGGGSSTGWFSSALPSLDPGYGHRFGWTSGGGSSGGGGSSSGGSGTGMAFGLPDLSSIGAISLGGPGAASFSRFSGGMHGGTWGLSGGFTMSPAGGKSILGFQVPSSLPLNFSYDGTNFLASLALGQTQSLTQGMSLDLTWYRLQRGHNDAAWTFSVLGDFSWLGSKAAGKVDLSSNEVAFTSFAPVTFALPGNHTLSFQNLHVGLGAAFACSADVTWPLPSGGVLSSVFGGATSLPLSFSAAPSGWSIKDRPGATYPPIHFPGGDQLSIGGVSLTKPQGVDNLVFTASVAMSFGADSFAGTLAVSGDAVAITIDKAKIGDVFDGIQVQATIGKDSAGNLTYDATLSGDLNRAVLDQLYGRYGLTAAGAGTQGAITLSGHLSKDAVSIDIKNFPPPQLPAVAGFSFEKLDDLSLSIDRSRKTERLGVAADLAIEALGTVRVQVGVLKTTASTSPDFSLTISDTSHPPQLSIPGMGTLVFTEVGGGRAAGKWSVNGQVRYDLPAAWHSLTIGTFQMPQSLTLNLALGESLFTLAADVRDAHGKAPQLDILPGFPLTLNQFQLSRVDGKLGFSILSDIQVPSGPKVGGGIGFDPSGVKFTCDPTVSFDLPIPPPIPGAPAAPTLADIRISGFNFSVGSTLALGGTVSVTLASPKKGKNMMEQVLGTNKLAASLQGTPSSFSLRTVGTTIKPPPLNLGPLGTATFSFDYIEVGSDGTLDVSGTIGLGQRSFRLTMGERKGEPFFAFEIEGNQPLELNVKDIFDFRLKGTIQIGTELGFPTMSVESVHLSVGSAQAPLGELDASNLVFWLPDPEYYFPGFVFFDDFHGYMDVGGLKANLDVNFPDPFSSANADAILGDIFNILSKQQWEPNQFSNLKAPAFGLSNVYVEFPTVPGLVWDASHKKFVQTPDLFSALFQTNQKHFVLVNQFSLKLSTLLDAICIPSPKDLGLMLLKDVSGTNTICILGLTASSTIGLGDKGFHSYFYLDQKIPASNPAIDMSGHFEGDIGADGSFYFEDAGSLKVKVGSSWETVESVTLKLSSKEGIGFVGKILGGSGSGSLAPDGAFSFKGNIDTKGGGKSGIVGSLTADNHAFDMNGQAYVDGQKIFTGDMSIDSKHIGFGLHVKDGDSRLDVDVKFGLSSPSVSFHGSASTKWGLVPVETGEVDWSISRHTISAHLKAAGANVATFEFDLHSGKVTVKGL